MKILVTGGAGFIGSHLVDLLIEKGHDVVVIDNLFSGKRENVNPKAKFVKMSVVFGDLSKVFENEKFDYVFHLAAQANLRLSLKEPKKDAEINIGGSLNVIENCIKYGIKKIIFSSTAALYSPDVKIPCDENEKAEPMSPYGLAKHTIEKHLKILNKLHKIDYAILRYANVYGPRQNPKGEAGVVSIFFDKATSGDDLKINGDGNQTRDFVYVKDVAAANITALENNLSGIFNVSSGKEISVNELAEKILRTSGKNGKILYSNEIEGELKRSCLNSDKLRKAGWEPRYDIDRGMKETAEYFKKIAA